MAEDIQGYLREQMPVWRAAHPGVEELRVAVMGCVVNGPGESKHAHIGISLPGTFEEPKAPVYIDGRLHVTLKGESIVPEFLRLVVRQLGSERERMQQQTALLGRNIEHIRQVISAQQAFAGVTGLVEEVALENVVEEAIRICGATRPWREHRIEREYTPISPVVIERHKVLQILVNLVSNAKHALEDRAGDAPRVLRISVRAEGGRDLVIEVEDNGIGIEPDVLSKIFNHGFTTRREGHGFGLHNSANAAQAMNGRLTAHSRGRGHGARFVLQLPLQEDGEERQLRHA